MKYVSAAVLCVLAAACGTDERAVMAGPCSSTMFTSEYWSVVNVSQEDTEARYVRDEEVLYSATLGPGGGLSVPVDAFASGGEWELNGKLNLFLCVRNVPEAAGK